MLHTHQQLTHCSLLVIAAILGSACSGDPLTIGTRVPAEGGNGDTLRGGTSQGGTSQGGTSQGGAATGGATPTVKPQGGAAAGGAAAGGAAPTVKPQGGAGQGGTAQGGSAPTTAGQGGSSPNACDGAIRYTYPDCGTCVQTVEEHCPAGSCGLDQSQICADTEFYGAWDRGCGYVRHRFDGDVGDHRVEIWEESTGKLAYSWNNGVLSMGCYPATTVGTEPPCAAWTNACKRDVCAGLAGQWTVTPTVTNLSPKNEWADRFPAVGASLDPLGLLIWEQEGACHVEWRPLWGRTGTAKLASQASDLATPLFSDVTTAWCGWHSWSLDQLVLSPGAAPTLSLSSHVSRLDDDMVFTASLQASGALVAGLPPAALRGAPISASQQPCLESDSPKAVASVLPWSKIVVGSSQPLETLGDHLTASIDNSRLPLGWIAPSDPNDVDRLAVAQLHDWERTMGKELRVRSDTSTTEEVVFSVAALPSQVGYVDDTLAALVTQGTRELDTSSGAAKLHLTGTSCEGAVSAAAILNTTEKSAVWFELEVASDAKTNGLTVDVIHTDGRRQAAILVTAEGANLRRYTAAIVGDSSVGVQIRASGGCQAETWWNPDIRIIGIGTE